MIFIDILLPSSVLLALDLLCENNFEAYLVGGCVRDYILGKAPSDFDISTNAMPNDIICIFNEYKTVLTGIKYGTVTVIIESLYIEITTYRIDDEYLNNRAPCSVTFTNSLLEDLSRRDFTMNALCYNPSTGIVDYFNGLHDINCGVIRCILDPKKRFNEDALRILRALRFASVLGFKIEDSTLSGIYLLKDLLLTISKERITQEMLKLMGGRFILNVIYSYKEIFFVLFPFLTTTHNMDLYINLLTLHYTKINPLFSIAVLFNQRCKSREILFKGVLDTFMVSKVNKSELLLIYKYINTPISTNIYNIKRWCGRLSYDIFFQLLSIKKGYYLAYRNILFRYLRKRFTKRSRKVSCCNFFTVQIIRIVYFINFSIIRIESIYEIAYKNKKENCCIGVDQMKINGNDLVNFGVKKGKDIGVTLKRLLQLIIDEKINNEYDDLMGTLNETFNK